MNDAPFMPKATAVWLVENTTLTFKQIAEFCNLHELEIKGIADGDVANGIKAYNPILDGQLSREEIENCSKDSSNKLSLLKKIEEVEVKTLAGLPIKPPDNHNALVLSIKYLRGEAMLPKWVGLPNARPMHSCKSLTVSHPGCDGFSPPGIEDVVPGV